MVYPGAGIANSTGSAWTPSYTTTGSGTVVALATGPTLTGPVLAAGSTSVAPLTFTSGTNLTSPVAGAEEYDGSRLFFTENTTTGRGYIPAHSGYLYTGAGSALGPTIADFFPANSSVQLLASTTYLVEAVCYFLKTTAGTVTWTWLASSAPSVMSSNFFSVPVTGFTTTVGTGTPVASFASIQTNTTLAHAATSSLTSAVYHVYKFNLLIRTNLATNLRLRVTSSAGTVTPQIGSYYRVEQISTAGTLAA